MRAACAILALALAALPCAAQTKQTNGTKTSAGGAASPGALGANVTDETKMVIPGDAAGAAGPAGTAAGAGAAAGGVRATGGGGTTWGFVRMIIILAAIIGVIYLLFWLLRKGAGKKVQENDLIRVLGSKSLGTTRNLHLVEVGTSIYLVGASDGGVELIAEVTDKESLDSVRLQAAEQAPAKRRGFQQMLAEIFTPAGKPLSVNDGIGLLKGQREKLKKL
jgi:flagellar biogenesis protein FliO